MFEQLNLNKFKAENILFERIPAFRLVLTLLSAVFFSQIFVMGWLFTSNITSNLVFILCNTVVGAFCAFTVVHYYIVRPFNLQMLDKVETDLKLLKLTTAIENTTSKIIITDKNGVIEYVNPALENQTGYIRDEVIGKRTGFNKSGQTSNETYEDLWHTLKNGVVWKGELVNRKKNGELVWDFVTISPIKDSNGEITNYLGIQQDISETKKIESALEMSQNLFRNIVLQNETGIVILSNSKRVLFANPAAERLLACHRCLIPGKQFNIPLNSNGTTELCIISDNEKPMYTELTTTTTHWEERPAELLMLHDITDRKNAEKLIEEMAYHDKLTGLPNRALFLDRLNQTLHYAQRNDKLFAILFLDLDCFKTVNDTLGHTIGDKLLKQAAERLQNCLRKNDTVARFGGDEFVILLMNIRLDEDAGKVVNHINLRLQTPFEIEDHQLYVTSSIGISIYPKDGIIADNLIKNADTAMYRAKELGRNNYQFFSPAIGDKAAHRLSLEKSLRKALEQNEFRLLFEPIMDVRTKTIVAAGVSIQWHHASEKLIVEEEMETFLEDSGLIVPVGEWIIKSVYQQLKLWKRNNIKPIKLYVKITKRQLEYVELFEALEQTILKFNPKMLVLEITDNIKLNSPSIIDKMECLRNMNLKVCINNFGAGLTPITLLNLFPVNSIKIDPSLIKDINNNDTSNIINAIISMTKHLDLSPIAQGVSSKVQSDTLAQKKCWLQQGSYLYSPMDIGELNCLLESHHNDADEKSKQNTATKTLSA